MIPAGVEGYHIAGATRTRSPRPKRHRRVSEIPLHVLTGIGAGVALAAGAVLLVVALW